MARVPEKHRRPSSGKRHAAAVSGRGARAQASILLVDDHPPNLIALEAILEPLGENLVLASSGGEAVAKAEHEDFALILLDLQMPELDGLATAALLKKLDRCHGVPIIILTANEPSRDTVAKGYASGAVDFLYKPLDPEVIRSKVGVFVDLWMQRQQRATSATRIAVPVRRAEQAELELRASEARTRLVLESAGLGTFVHNPVTGALLWDARARAMYGVEPDAPIDEQVFLERVHPDDRSRVAEYTRLALDPRSDGDYDIEYRTLGERWIAARGQAFIESGRTVRFVGTLLDITSRKVVEQERIALLAREQSARAEAERAVARAEEASRAKDEFLATVSHELRNPLNAILGWSRVLLDDDDRLSAERRRQGLEVIARNTKAQVQLVEDILDVSRIVNGKLRLSTRPADVRAICEAAIDTMRAASNGKGLSLSLAAGRDVGTILADEDRIQQILWNLLSNAVKFTPPGGHVVLEARRAVSEVTLSVTDSGEGISPAFLPFVFDRFRQADGTTTREHGGLGLGLAIVRHLVELHGGTVRASSAGLGSGSTFTVSLPFSAPESADEERTSRSSAVPAAQAFVATPRLANIHVLVLDDDEDMRDLIALILEDAGALVTRASNVTNAMAAIAQSCPHVAVSDLAMPGEDGYGFVKRVRTHDDPKVRSLPLVAMTAYARAEDRHRVLDAGFQRHIAKPIEPAELVETLAQML